MSSLALSLLVCISLTQLTLTHLGAFTNLHSLSLSLFVIFIYFVSFHSSSLPLSLFGWVCVFLMATISLSLSLSLAPYLLNGVWSVELPLIFPTPTSPFRETTLPAATRRRRSDRCDVISVVFFFFFCCCFVLPWPVAVKKDFGPNQMSQMTKTERQNKDRKRKNITRKTNIKKKNAEEI